MQYAVYGTSPSRESTEALVMRLKEAGFSPDDISVLFRDKHESADFAKDKDTKAPQGAATGGVAGAGLGAVLGWLAGVGSLAIPGAGPFIAAGPIMGALSGGAVGGATGGIIGALVGLGLPDEEAKRYDEKIRSGNALVSVHADSIDEKNRAEHILSEAGAENISSSVSEASGVYAPGSDRRPGYRTTPPPR